MVCAVLMAARTGSGRILAMARAGRRASKVVGRCRLRGEEAPTKEEEMKFLYIGSHGSEDPTRATLTLLMAKGAKEAGHDVEIALQGDAVVLFHDRFAENTHGVGVPAAKELLDTIRSEKIPVYG